MPAGTLQPGTTFLQPFETAHQGGSCCLRTKSLALQNRLLQRRFENRFQVVVRSERPPQTRTSSSRNKIMVRAKRAEQAIVFHLAGQCPEFGGFAEILLDILVELRRSWPESAGEIKLHPKTLQYSGAASESPLSFPKSGVIAPTTVLWGPNGMYVPCANANECRTKSGDAKDVLGLKRA